MCGAVVGRCRGAAHGGELPGPVTDQDLELVGAVTEVHEQVARGIVPRGRMTV
jgi:hypothetical protein